MDAHLGAGQRQLLKDVQAARAAGMGTDGQAGAAGGVGSEFVRLRRPRCSSACRRWE
ncbi:hypothetical protein [Streptomyces sp. NPDC051572]|uniref:hypothetical protein n=1 Tax=Streptomyces sp. NPDC051572 TaxID=3155802 RepID=UPI00344E7762